MSYDPPSWNSVDIDLGSVGYTPSAWNAANVEVNPTSIGPQFITASGFGGENFGAHLVTAGAVTLRPAALNAGAIGSATISNYTRHLLPSGMVGAFGNASIILRTRMVYPTGLNAGSMGFTGGGSVTLGRRIVEPTAVAPGAVGSLTVTQEIREINLAGRSIIGTAFGTQFVAYRERFVYPRAITGFAKGYPTVDKTHYVDESGWDSSAFGLSWIHDNKQYAEGAGNISAIAWGLPEITRSPRVLAPLGIALRDVLPNERWGIPDLHNARQYVYHYHYSDFEHDEGGVFGSPFHTLVENRNRTIGVTGFNAGKISHALSIDNTGRALLPEGWDSMHLGFRPNDGEGFIAYAIRTVTPTDPIGPETFTRYHAVIPTPQLMPHGIAPAGAVDVPTVTRGPQAEPGGFDHSAFGTAYIDFAIRTVFVYWPPEGSMAMPDVQLSTRYVSPTGIAPKEVGGHYVEEHFTIFRPHGWVDAKVGLEHYVRNLTPELGTYGKDQAEFGLGEIRWNPYPLTPFAIQATVFGATDISHRERHVTVSGVNAVRWGPNTLIYNADPDPPSNRRYELTGFSTLGMGYATVRRNEIGPTGFDSSRYGLATASLMGAIGAGVDDETVFGTATVIGARFLLPVGLPAPDDPASAQPKPKPRVDPYHIYATNAAPQGYAQNNGGNWELIDARFEAPPLSPYGARPFFGLAWVSNQRRAVSAAGSSFSAVGEPTLDLRNRRIYLDGIKSLRMGYPLFPHDETIEQWGSAEDGASFGSTALQLRNRSVLPSGVAPAAVGGGSVEHFNREVKPTGWDSFRMSAPVPYDDKNFGPLSTNVGPPRPRLPVGFDATIYGDAFISNWVRTIEPAGFETFVEGYTPGAFNDRMRVTQRRYLRPAGIVNQDTIGLPMVAARDRTVSSAGRIVAGGVPAPSVRYQSIIALASYGFDASTVGVPAKWQAGDPVAPYGADMLQPGYPRIDRVVRTAGYEAALFGSAAVGPHLVPSGFDASAFGLATMAYADGAEFVCGQRPRAIPAPGFGGESFGGATVGS